MKLRIRLGEKGMQIELQDDKKVTELLTIDWPKIRVAIDINVYNYLVHGMRFPNCGANPPTFIHEFNSESNALIWRMRATKAGIEVERQEGNTIVDCTKIQWHVLKKVISADVYEYIRRSWNPVNSYMQAPVAVHEFIIAEQ